MGSSQIFWIVLIVVGVVLIAVSFILSGKEKSREEDEDIEAYKQELKTQMDQVFDEHVQAAQMQAEQAAREAMVTYAEEAKREIEVARNEAKDYLEELFAQAKQQMEACVKQTEQETDSITEDLKHDLETMAAAQTEQIEKNLDAAVNEINNHHQEVLALYAMINGKQEELDAGIMRIHAKTAQLEESVSIAEQRALGVTGASDTAFEKLAAQVRDEVVQLLNERRFAEAKDEEVSREALESAPDVKTSEKKPAKRRADKSAEEAAKREAKEAAKREAEEAAKREAEEAAKREAEEAAKREAKEAAKREAEEAAKQAADDLNATKTINREELRDALQAMEQAEAENASEAAEDAEAEEELFFGDEIDINEVFVADVEEFDTIAAETVKEAVREALDEDEKLASAAENLSADKAEADAEEAANGEKEVPLQNEEAAAGAKQKASSKYRVMRTVLQKGTDADETPADMVLEDEPNIMLKAVRSSGTVSTEADMEMRKRVLKMYDQGHSSMDIAEALKLGIGEVRMIVDLYSRRER